MALRALFLLLATALFAGCIDQPADVVVHTRLLKVAGEHAIDCGRAATPDQYAQQSKCALDALHRGTPFLVQYKVPGTGAQVEEGIASNARQQQFHVEKIFWDASYRGDAPAKFATDLCRSGSVRQLGDEQLTCDFTPSD